MQRRRKFKYILFLSLASVLPALAHGKGLLAPLDPSCAGAYAKLSGAEKLEISEIGARVAPDVHAFNMDELLSEFGKFEKFSFQLWKSRKNELDAMICSGYPHPSACFLVAGALPEKFGKFTLKFKTPSGEMYEVPASISSGALGRVDANLQKLTKVEKHSPDLAAGKQRALASYRGLNFDRMDADELGSFLSARQLKTSKNAAKSEGEKKIKFEQGIKEANLLLAKKLKANKSLTTDDVDLLNFFANQGVDPYEQNALAPVAGVMRGTSNRTVVQNDNLYRIDLTNVQVEQGWNNHSILNFLPANEVPAKMTKLLTEVDKITPSTDPLAIFSLYRNFIQIHPYMDGNGRTARMLLNYMLLKAQMAPSPRALESINFSSEEIFEQYLKEI